MTLIAEDLGTFFDESKRDAPVHFIVNDKKVADEDVYIVRHRDFDGDCWVEIKIKTEQPAS